MNIEIIPNVQKENYYVYYFVNGDCDISKWYSSSENARFAYK